MNSIALLSLLLAAGIIIGIGLTLFGFIKRAQGKTMRFSGIALLFACLFGLMLLLANHGQKRSEAQDNKQLILSYQVLEQDSLGNLISKSNGLENYPKPVYLVGNSDTLILFNKEAGILQDLIVRSSNDLYFPCFNETSWSAFCGNFHLESSTGPQLIYSKQKKINGSVFLEEIQVQSIKNP
ncbi:MAG: hypothetical protein ACPGED_03355 [Flavobacteriales bacterium]